MLARAEALIDRKKHPATLLELYCSQSVCAMLLGKLADVLEPARAAEALRSSNAASSEHGDYFYVFVVRTARVSALQFLGRHREAAEVARQLLSDAELTDNRCAALQATMLRTNMEQAQDCCRDSRLRLDAERAELPHAGVSVLHMLHVISAVRTACITEDHVWALEIFADFEPKFRKSPLRHSGFLVYLLRVSHARLLLNHHVVSQSKTDPVSLISDHLHWLTHKGPVPFRKLAPKRLLARLSILRNDHTRAAQLLDESMRAHVEVGAVDEAERDRYAIGMLSGGEEGKRLTEAATAALRSMGISDPGREIHGYYPELARHA